MRVPPKMRMILIWLKLKVKMMIIQIAKMLKLSQRYEVICMLLTSLSLTLMEMSFSLILIKVL